MTGDVYIEDSVVCVNNGAKNMFVLSAICLGISVLGLMFASLFFAVPVIFFIFLTLRFYLQKHVAYDYTYTNGLFEIARVSNNSKRKLLFSSEFENLEILALNDSDEIKQFESNKAYKTLPVFVGEEDRTLYAALFNVEGRLTKVVFEPCTEMLKAMKKQYPAKVKYIERR